MKILKALLQAKPVNKITREDLQRLVGVLPEEEFKNFCKDKGIDITSNRFEDLELSRYELEELEPALKLKDQKYTMLNLLLNQTHSDKLPLEEIRKIYTTLYELDPMNKDMMVSMATLVHSGDSIKIAFSDKESSIITLV